MSRQPGRRAQRTHLLGGCQNCRDRHAKCDQSRPGCLMCTTAGLKCQGYEANVQWVAVSGCGISQEKLGTRAHLYTEEARSLMSGRLTDYFRIRTVDSTLTEIDSLARGDEPLQTGSAMLGPFGVLDIAAQVIGAEGQTDRNSSINTGSAEQFDVNHDLPDISHESASVITTPSILDSLVGIPDHLDWSDIFNLDVESWFSPQLGAMDFDTVLDQNNISMPLAGLNATQVQTTSSLWSPVAETMDEALEQQAPYLIRHFDSEVIGSIASLPFTQKSPYKILNVAAAVQAYADITYLRRPIKHASLANLYGILACSAQNLATNPSGTDTAKATYWHNLANSFAQKAKEQLQRSLREELEGPNKAKYKDQVMALMNLLAYAVAAGHQRNVRCYLIDIERLLRLRGLPKRHISRRARLLHHMYTWNRIVGESTYVLHDENSATIAFTRPIPRPQMNNVACLDDFLRIESGDEDDVEEAEPNPEPDVALRDVHLQDTRHNPNTMYLQIYGLPETWLSLLSQTTRLANAKELLTRDTKHAVSLKNRISRLEDMICTFASNHPVDRLGASAPPSQHMLQALNSALVIFFYRRIRGVNSLILQSHVDDVIKSLSLFDASLSRLGLNGPGTAWPAFIAGCEAAPGPRRDTLLGWIETAHWKTGSHCFQAAKEMMEDVWARRREQANSPTSSRSGANRSSDTSATWINLSREKKTWIILC